MKDNSETGIRTCLEGKLDTQNSRILATLEALILASARVMLVLLVLLQVLQEISPQVMATLGLVVSSVRLPLAQVGGCNAL